VPPEYCHHRVEVVRRRLLHVKLVYVGFQVVGEVDGNEVAVDYREEAPAVR